MSKEVGKAKAAVSEARDEERAPEAAAKRGRGLGELQQLHALQQACCGSDSACWCCQGSCSCSEPPYLTPVQPVTAATFDLHLQRTSGKNCSCGQQAYIDRWPVGSCASWQLFKASRQRKQLLQVNCCCVAKALDTAIIRPQCMTHSGRRGRGREDGVLSQAGGCIGGRGPADIWGPYESGRSTQQPQAYLETLQYRN